MNKIDDVLLGATFSYPEARRLGLDFRKCLQYAIHLGLNPIRVGVYWNEIEAKKGRYDFSILDQQMKMLSDSKTDVVLEIGMKAPRYPEYYIPSWLVEKVDLQPWTTLEPIPELIGELLKFLETVLKRYKDDHTIKWLNIENEPFNYAGPNNLRISPEIVLKEIEIVRKLFDKPIILNTWLEMHPWKRFKRNLIKREKSVELCLELGDILGISVYPKYPGQLKIKAKHWYFINKLKKKTESFGKECWITELQAEPWEISDSLKNFKDPYGNPSCNPDNVIEYINIVENYGFRVILLWGVEFWYKCQKEGNKEWLRVVKKVKK